MHRNAGTRDQSRQPVADAIVDQLERLGRATVERNITQQREGSGIGGFGAVPQPREVARHDPFDMGAADCF